MTQLLPNSNAKLASLGMCLEPLIQFVSNVLWDVRSVIPIKYNCVLIVEKDIAKFTIHPTKSYLVQFVPKTVKLVMKQNASLVEAHLDLMDRTALPIVIFRANPVLQQMGLYVCRA